MINPCIDEIIDRYAEVLNEFRFDESDVVWTYAQLYAINPQVMSSVIAGAAVLIKTLGYARKRNNGVILLHLDEYKALKDA